MNPEQRARRLARIAEVSALMAEAARVEALRRQDEQRKSEAKLQLIQRYNGEYSLLSTAREAEATSVAAILSHRSFAGWLGQLADQQQEDLVRAVGLTERALAEATAKRIHARSLGAVAAKARLSARKEAERREQRQLDDLSSTSYAQAGTDIARGW